MEETKEDPNRTVPDLRPPAVLVLSKYDLLAEKTQRALKLYTENIRQNLKFLAHVPIVMTSAKTGARTTET